MTKQEFEEMNEMISDMIKEGADDSDIEKRFGEEKCNEYTEYMFNEWEYSV